MRSAADDELNTSRRQGGVGRHSEAAWEPAAMGIDQAPLVLAATLHRAGGSLELLAPLAAISSRRNVRDSDLNVGRTR